MFRDTTHLSNYLNFLNDITSGASDSINTRGKDTLDEHKILLSVEQGLGFTSIREISHADYLRKEANRFPTLEDIPDEHFIIGNDIKSILNKNLEVKIGDRVTHYVNEKVAMSILAGKTGMLNAVRSLDPNTATIADVLLLDPTRKFMEVYELTGKGRTWGSLGETPLGVDRITGPDVLAAGGCTNLSLREFQHLALLVDNQYAAGYFEIDFGDGTYDTKYSSYSFVPPFQHQYGNLPVYRVKIKAYYYQGGPLKDKKEFDIYMDNGIVPTCKNDLMDSDWQYISISTNEALGGRLKLQTMKPFLRRNSPKTRVYTETKLVRWDGGGWLRYKGNKYAYLNCLPKDNLCHDLTASLIEGITYTTNDYTQTMQRTGDGEFFWSSIRSYHSHYNGTLHELVIEREACD